MKLFWSLCLCVALGCSTPRPQNKYSRAQQSVVLLESSHGFGSGFVIQRGNRVFLWTAAHVVTGVNSVKVRQVIRYENRKVGETSFSAVVIARDESLDLALLWLDADPQYFSPVTFGVSPVVGDAVYHCGNFLGPAFDGSVSTGVVSQIGVHPSVSNWPWPGPLDQMTSVVLPGSSGGPVFAADGSVVGVVVGHISAGVEFFVPVRAVRDFVKNNFISWAVDGANCPSDFLLKDLAALAAVVPPPTNKPDTQPEE